MLPLFLKCLFPVILISALSAAAVYSVHRWPSLWPESVRMQVLRITDWIGVRYARVIRWFAPHRGDALDPVQLRIRVTRTRYGIWIAQPANKLTLRVAFGWLIALTLGVAGLLAPADTLLNQAAISIIVVSSGIFLFDLVFRKRTALMEKERIVRDLGSRSNHVALDAARVVVTHNWHRDGSLSDNEFEHANLRGLTMARARFGGTSFMYANLANAELMFADLRGARLGSSTLRHANLSFSYLDEAVLGLADLESASLGRCSLRAAHLEGANLRDAFLEHADLEGAHLEQAIYNAKTRWPEGFTPPAGAINWDTLSDAERDWFRQWRWYLT